MKANHALIQRLRDLALEGASVRAMVDEIRSAHATADGLALVADRYFKAAFLLPLGDIRTIEGSACLGGMVHSDEEIDRIMRPRIASTRHLWNHESQAT